jgi:membrane associated rhomboid family serine protease
MGEQDMPVDCVGCGTTLPRRDMFGVEPDLRCPRCASGVRRRMQVRVRPRVEDRAPTVTKIVLGIAALFFVLGDFVYANPLTRPDWFVQLLVATRPSQLIWSGEVWTLLGSAFWHIGFLHILFNAWWIWDLGRAVESGFGRWALVLLVAGGAMVASGVEWMVRGPGVGLSGVVYALALFLFVHRRSNPFAAQVMNRRTLNFLLMWFVLCIVLTESGTWNVGNWAHGAGAAWGYLAGEAVRHRLRRLWVPVAIVLTVALIAATPYVTFSRRQAAFRAWHLRGVAQGHDWHAELEQAYRTVVDERQAP